MEHNKMRWNEVRCREIAHDKSVEAYDFKGSR